MITFIMCLQVHLQANFTAAMIHFEGTLTLREAESYRACKTSFSECLAVKCAYMDALDEEACFDLRDLHQT